MNIEKVIEILADGGIHSGEELGAALGVSRTAVWKQLKKLEGMGLCVESVKGRGYRLPNGLELLELTKLKAQVSEQMLTHLTGIELFGSIDSTNTHVMNRAQDGAGHGLLCLAEHQTSGRGRQGRQWVSPYGRNIYLSLGWQFVSGVAALEGLSLAIGLAIARALTNHGVEGVQLKWPNDVLINHHKVAGVLLEMTGDASGVCQVVVGVGINVHMLESEAKDIDQAWVSVGDIKKVSRNTLAGDLVHELLVILSEFEAGGFAPLREEWEAFDLFRDRDVCITAGDQVTEGRVLGVSDNGALRLHSASGDEQLIYGGEASLRRAS
ncbi:bifunctional biotin--[acetyl-CoA-carboxylase] ligase/biotin operon repressor BirA [Aurantivibrio plasticivorans]